MAVSPVNGQSIPDGVDAVAYNYWAGALKTPGLVQQLVGTDPSQLADRDRRALAALGVSVTPVGVIQPMYLIIAAVLIWYFFFRS